LLTTEMETTKCYLLLRLWLRSKIRIHGHGF